MRRAYNGQLIDLNAQELMDKVIERKSSVFTERANEDYLYFISIHFEEIFGVLDENTEYYIDIVREDLKGNQERVTNYREHSHLKADQVVKKINAFRDYVC